MNPKDKIDEKKEFEISFDDLDTAKAKAEAEINGEPVEEEKDKPEKVVEKTEDIEEDEGEEEIQDKSKETKKEDKAPAKEEPKKEVDKKSFPKKNENESDESYNLRMQLEIAKQGRENATSDEEKSVFEKKMDDLRKNLSEVNKDPKKVEVKKESAEEDKEDEADLEENLKKKGFIKADEVEKIFKDRMNEIRKNEIIDGHQKAINAFYKDRPDIKGNKDVRDFLESEVINLIKPDLNTTPKQLFDALKLVANAHFPKANKSQNAQRGQEKVDLMNIQGDSKGTQKKTSVGDKEGDLLRSMGWTDDQIASFG